MATRDRAVPAPEFENLLASREIVIFCGSGGVGKTSMAAASATMAAARLGGNVLVLTVDPARRLATALGLDGGIGNVEREVPAAVLREAGVEPRGKLFAAMLDTKRSWDDLVHRYAPDEATAYQILSNPLYENITGRFVNAHEFIAMERLYDIHQSGRYDLIVIDTPPTRNAIDFLNAPQRMAEFFGGFFLKVLTLPYRVGGKRGARALDFVARPFYRIADGVLGSAFMRDLGEFFLHFQTMNEGFVQRAQAVERLLHDRRTTFVVVSTLEFAPLAEARFFCEELTAMRFHLGALILNRVLPGYLCDPEAGHAAGRLLSDASIASKLAAVHPDMFADTARVAGVLTTIAENFVNFATVAKREAEERHEVASGAAGVVPDVITAVPQLASDIADLSGLVEIGRALFR
jgi:anion-transporting  ArsA/GET3 family ATPase